MRLSKRTTVGLIAAGTVAAVLLTTAVVLLVPRHGGDSTGQPDPLVTSTTTTTGPPDPADRIVSKVEIASTYVFLDPPPPGMEPVRTPPEVREIIQRQTDLTGMELSVGPPDVRVGIYTDSINNGNDLDLHGLPA